MRRGQEGSWVGGREGRKTQGLTRVGRQACARSAAAPSASSRCTPPAGGATDSAGWPGGARPPGPPGCVRRTQRALPWFPGSIGPSASVRHDPLSRLNEAERFASVCALVLRFVHSPPPEAIVPGQFRFRPKS